jgi:peptide-methionine (S)-S-oxide reductase
MKNIFVPLAFLALAACSPAQSAETRDMSPDPQVLAAVATSGPLAPFQNTRTDGLSEMIIAGGCFWCVESDFEKMDGVVEAISGYSGGTLDNPDYKTVSYTETGHYEVVKVIFDPNVVTYRALVDAYWRTVDPTDAKGQFCDKGTSYRTAVFATPEQMAAAQASLAEIKADKPFAAPIVTPILPAVTFYDAENYHQDYYKKNKLRYKYYRNGCGRDKRLKKLWGG